MSMEDNTANIKFKEKTDWPTSCRDLSCGCWSVARSFHETNMTLGEAGIKLHEQLMKCHEIIKDLRSYQDHVDFRSRELMIAQLQGKWPIYLCLCCEGSRAIGCRGKCEFQDKEK